MRNPGKLGVGLLLVMMTIGLADLPTPASPGTPPTSSSMTDVQGGGPAVWACLACAGFAVGLAFGGPVIILAAAATSGSTLGAAACIWACQTVIWP